MPTLFDAAPTLAHLRDFQRETVEHGFRRLYRDADSTRRYLVADETGLGKTHIARGIIAKTIEHLQHERQGSRIDIIYVCSNLDIADQNLRKLVVTGGKHSNSATRLTMLVAQPDLLRPATDCALKPVTFISFTPGTSLDLGGQTGRAEERAVLYLLVSEYLGIDGAEDTALKRILQGGVASLGNFDSVIYNVMARVASYDDEELNWEPGIRNAFFAALKKSKEINQLSALIDEVRGQSKLNSAQGQVARELIIALRQLLARASLRALEPDLIILDEFQRFADLLTPPDGEQNDAAELAQQLFEQDDARVLLLSATPYKPFTLAEEAQGGEDHYEDFFRTLDFLDHRRGNVTVIRKALSDFRRAVLAGDSVDTIRTDLEGRLVKLLTRRERPAADADGGEISTRCRTNVVAPQDMAGFVALHRLAEAVQAPISVEYWKSAPYFANFLDGYKVGDRVKDALGNAVRYQDLLPLLKATQRIRRRDVDQLKKIDWGNTRLRELAADTIDKGWWKLLWIPPSMPYVKPAGVYADFADGSVTKRLIFSSWVAAPSAIAALMSHEAHRRISEAASQDGKPRDSRHTLLRRLQYRLDAGKPAAMTTLALFWPNPSLAALTDPLVAASAAAGHELPGQDALEAWAQGRISSLLGGDGKATTSTSTAWVWHGALGLRAADGAYLDLPAVPVRDLVAVLAGDELTEEDDDGTTVQRGLNEHVLEAQRIVRAGVLRAGSDRPIDLVKSVALIGLAGPGNIAWRALKRLAGPNVSNLGLWRAAARLASGFRSLFNRAESMLLLDHQYAGEEESYWRSVLSYCRDGNLQAVMDEFLHHLAESDGLAPDTDDALMALAVDGSRAMGLRPARYLGADVDSRDRESIPFPSRFALRFGGVRQDQDDVRLPEVRAAFNSPFWPFVLASTSIGQEGVDFHWWCHAVVHWNLPSNPVDFEQREGRVNRYKGHAIRKNVAAAFRIEVLSKSPKDPWGALFTCASREHSARIGDLMPYWVFPGPSHIERHLYEFPLSKDQNRWRKLKETLVLYRLAYGQPRQEDLVELLAGRGVSAESAVVDGMKLRLVPPESAIR